MPSWSEFSDLFASRPCHLQPSPAPCVHAPGAFALVLPVGLSVSVPCFFTTHVFKEIPMLTCPKCQSPRLESRDLGRNTGCAVGALAGAASGAASALRGARLGAAFGAFAGPAGSVLGGLAGAALGGLVGGAIGCEVGSKIGEAVDQNCLDNLRCLDCHHTFGVSPA